LLGHGEQNAHTHANAADPTIATTEPATPVSTRKKLIPKKFGMFSKTLATSPHATMTNAEPTANDDNDVFMHGGLGDLSEGFPLLGQDNEEDAANNAAHDAALRQSFPAADMDTAGIVNAEKSKENVQLEPLSAPVASEEDDGYQADAEEQRHQENEQKEEVVEETAQPQKKRGRPAGVTKKPTQPSAERYQTRGASKINKITARSATMHMKAKKQDKVAGQPPLRSARVGRSGVRGFNPRGDGGGLVLISGEKIDWTKVEKHW